MEPSPKFKYEHIRLSKPGSNIVSFQAFHVQGVQGEERGVLKEEGWIEECSKFFDFFKMSRRQNWK